MFNTTGTTPLGKPTIAIFQPKRIHSMESKLQIRSQAYIWNENINNFPERGWGNTILRSNIFLWAQKCIHLWKACYRPQTLPCFQIAPYIAWHARCADGICCTEASGTAQRLLDQGADAHHECFTFSSGFLLALSPPLDQKPSSWTGRPKPFNKADPHFLAC